MSEENKEIHKESSVSPEVVPESNADSGLPDNIETPNSASHNVDDKNKKEVSKLNFATKAGIGFMGVAGVFFVWQMFFAGSGTTQQDQRVVGQAPVSTMGFDKAKAADKSLDPEAAKLDEIARLKKAEEAQKKGESTMVIEPFGSDTNKGENLKEAKDATEGVTQTDYSKLAPPPLSIPQPPQNYGNDNGEKKMSAHDIYQARILSNMKVSSPSVSLGANGPIARTASNSMSSSYMGQQSGAMPVSGKAPIYDITAGTEYFAQLTNGLNSLVPETPARAVIAGGKYSGAILLGKVATKDDKYMVIQFNMMSIGKNTYPIEAIATSAETGQAGLADDVNSRFIERNGIGAVLGFAQAIGAATIKEGQQSTTTMGANGMMSSSNNPTLTAKQKLMIGLGGAGQASEAAAAEYQKGIRPEVMVYKDKELKVIFTKPFSTSIASMSPLGSQQNSFQQNQ